MENPQQTKPILMTLDELFKKVFPGLTHLIEKIQILKVETITPRKSPSNPKV